MTKKKSIVFGLLVAIMIAIASIFCFGGSVNASAATMTNVSYKYQLNVSGTAIDSVYLYSNSYAANSTVVSNGDIFGFSPSHLEVRIEAKIGSVRYFSYYGISSVSLSGNKSYSDTTEHSNNSSVVSSVEYTLPTLSSGYYTLTINYFTQNRQSGNNSKVEGSVKFSFYVDKTAPTVTGASSSSTGKYTNKAFTVSASDSLSGGVTLYMSEPNSGSYNTVGGSSKTVQLGSTNGLYRFQATDKAGNSSGIYYVYFDDTVPVGKAVTSKGEEIKSGESVSESFSFSATDSGSGITSTKYKRPNSSVWENYTAGTTISVNDGYGAYVFQVTDKCGNVLEYSVEIVDACAGGHQYYISNTVEPTCTSGGYTLYTCSVCGQTMKSNVTAALGHSYKTSTSSSSCTEGGQTTYTCTRCGYSYTEQTSEAAGHNYITSVKEATCTEGGYTTYTCTKCGYSYRGSSTKPLGHNFISESVSATCTEGGGTVYTCTRCNYSYHGSQTVALGHAYVSHTVAATCEEGGYTEHICSRCGDEYTDNITKPLGHNFLMASKEATCTEYGMIVYTCQVCGYEMEEPDGVYPTGHTYSNYIVAAATCTQDGERRYVCDKCGEEYTEVIPAMGHNYAITDSSSENGITTRVYTCTLCGDSYTQELGDQYEEVSSYIEELFEQYRPYMWWVLLVTAGIWSIVMGVFFAIAQKNEDKEKAKKMIVNYFVGLVVIFAILVACPYLIRGIAALIT